MNDEATKSQDFANHDLFKCVGCGSVHDIEDSIATDHGLACPACSHVETA